MKWVSQLSKNNFFTRNDRGTQEISVAYYVLLVARLRLWSRSGIQYKSVARIAAREVGNCERSRGSLCATGV